MREKIKNAVKNTIKKINPTAKVILFGSRARGEASQDSDWDFLILTDKEVDFLAEDKYRTPIFLLELEFGEVFSLHFSTKLAWENAEIPLKENIEKEGITL